MTPSRLPRQRAPSSGARWSSTRRWTTSTSRWPCGCDPPRTPGLRLRAAVPLRQHARTPPRRRQTAAIAPSAQGQIALNRSFTPHRPLLQAAVGPLSDAERIRLHRLMVGLVEGFFVFVPDWLSPAKQRSAAFRRDIVAFLERIVSGACARAGDGLRSLLAAPSGALFARETPRLSRLRRGPSLGGASVLRRRASDASAGASLSLSLTAERRAGTREGDPGDAIGALLAAVDEDNKPYTDAVRREGAARLSTPHIPSAAPRAWRSSRAPPGGR